MLSIQNLHAQQIQYGQVKQWKSYSLTFWLSLGCHLALTQLTYVAEYKHVLK